MDKLIATITGSNIDNVYWQIIKQCKSELDVLLLASSIYQIAIAKHDQCSNMAALSKKIDESFKRKNQIKNNTTDPFAFRSALLQHCQTAFEAGLTHEKQANITFIAELFKAQLLTEGILVDCLKKLFDTDVDCFLLLFENAGTNMSPAHFSQIIDLIRPIFKGHSVPNNNTNITTTQMEENIEETLNQALSGKKKKFANSTTIEDLVNRVAHMESGVIVEMIMRLSQTRLGGLSMFACILGEKRTGIKHSLRLSIEYYASTMDTANNEAFMWFAIDYFNLTGFDWETLWHIASIILQSDFSTKKLGNILRTIFHIGGHSELFVRKVTNLISGNIQINEEYYPFLFKPLRSGNYRSLATLIQAKLQKLEKNVETESIPNNQL